MADQGRNQAHQVPVPADHDLEETIQDGGSPTSPAISHVGHPQQSPGQGIQGQNSRISSIRLTIKDLRDKILGLQRENPRTSRIRLTVVSKFKFIELKS